MSIVKEWMFVNVMGAFMKPDEKDACLFGKIYNDYRSDLFTTEFNDGHRIISSVIKNIDWDNRQVNTSSGSIYNLEGNPNKEYVEWLSREGCFEKYVNILMPFELMN